MINCALIKENLSLTLGPSQDDLLNEPTNKHHLLLALLYDLAFLSVSFMEKCGTRIRSSVISHFSTCHFKVNLFSVLVGSSSQEIGGKLRRVKIMIATAKH